MSKNFSLLQTLISQRNQDHFQWFLIPWIRFEVIFRSISFPQVLPPISCPIWSISKITSRNSLFPCGFDLYLPLYPSIRYIFIKLVSSELFLTRYRVKSMTSRSHTKLSLSSWAVEVWITWEAVLIAWDFFRLFIIWLHMSWLFSWCPRKRCVTHWPLDDLGHSK